MRTSKPTCLVPAGDVCGEAVLWSARDKAVFWTDIYRFLIHRYDTESQSSRSWFFDEPVVALSLTTDPGRLLVALGSKLIWWWPETNRRQDHGFTLPDAPGMRLNEGRADPLGNFWIGSMRNEIEANGEAGAITGADGILYCIRPDGSATEWGWGIGIPNTMCWSPDRRTLYTGDTPTNEIWAFDFDAARVSIGNRRRHFAAFERGLPDGSAIDAEGFLWNCRFFGRCIARVAPSGTVDRVIDMPIKNVATACFGGPDLKTLFVTSAMVLRDPGDRLAGSLWAVETDVPGLPENTVEVDPLK